MKIIAIRDMSAGNETVGEMWQETKIFDSDTPLIEVLKWAGTEKKITISLPDNEIDNFLKLTEKDVPF